MTRHDEPLMHEALMLRGKLPPSTEFVLRLVQTLACETHKLVEEVQRLQDQVDKLELRTRRQAQLLADKRRVVQ